MKAKGLVLALGLGLAGCVAEVGGGLHHLAYYPSGLCQGVEVEVLGASPTRIWVEGDPTPKSLLTELPPTAEPPTPGEALAAPVWRWRGDLRLSYSGEGTVQYRLTCLPYGLPSLTTPALSASGEVGLVVTEDPGSPSGLRVAVKR